MIDTTDPTGMTVLDAVPANAHRVELLAQWLIDGRGQNVLAAREYARRCFKARYLRNPKDEQWSAAYRLASRMA